MENRASCSHSGTFEAWLLTLICVGAAAIAAACALLCVRCGACARKRKAAEESLFMR